MKIELSRLEITWPKCEWAVCGYNTKYQHESLPIYFLYLKLGMQAMEAGSSYIEHIIPAFYFRS